MPSPHPSVAGLLPSPHSGSSGAPRPPLMKRHSSQQSHGSSKHGLVSPSSAGEHHQPLRHHVKPVRKTKILLPRNNSSARNLAKLARHGSDQYAQNAAQEARKHSRQKSHEGDEGIRLPGSLEESRPQIKRNLTSSNLPRNTSHTKLKKNLSHGQLARIGSGRNLQGLNQAKGPPSPGLKGRSRKKKSLDSGYPEKDLHEQEMEIARQQQAAKEGPRRVGFAVGDGNESSEDDDGLQMEGSGLQEDEWADQSASASPATTRQNTANNSRRPSVSVDKPPDHKTQLREAVAAKDMQQPHYQHSQAPAPEADGTPAASDESETEDDEENPPSPRSMPQSHKPNSTHLPTTSEPAQPSQSEPPATQQTSTPKSRLHAAKDHPNPFTKQLINRSSHSPAPALVSNVSAMDETRSARGSPAASMRSSRSNIAEAHPDQEGELVSRFIPSALHPITSSGGNTTMNTPKTGSYQTPESESVLADHHHRDNRPLQHAPTSPGSTISGSSGATTPAMLRSRTELRMANERAMAEIEESGKPQLMIPAHRFDRRNESLKSYLNVAALGGGGGGSEGVTGARIPAFGPEIFEGRFKAVNTELKVVQRFRDPLGESLARLGKCEGGKRFGELRAKGAKTAERVAISSKSVTDLGKQRAEQQQQLQAKSASPAKSAMLASRSATNVARSGGAGGMAGGVGSESRRGGSGRVKFSQGPPAMREVEHLGGGGEEDLSSADAIARQLWDAAERKA